MTSGINLQGLTMRSKHLFPSLACAVVLAGCASAPPAPAPKAAPTIASLMSDAEAAIGLGKQADALAMLKSAATAFPQETAPRLRAAQVQFELHHYGEAITYAQEVIDRAPGDIAANSILAASGLRVSSRALTDLAARNNMVGSVRAEAQDLVRVVRANIKDDIIPKAKSHGKAVSRRMPAQSVSALPPGQPKPAGDSPADWLNK